MPQRRAKTLKHRALKTKKLGASSKAFRENHGTTASLPATGALPTIRAGRLAKDVEVPAELVAKLAKRKQPAKPAAKKAAKA